MKHLIKTVSFLAIMTVIPGAFAATSRAGVVGQAASRRISIAGHMQPVSIVGGTVVGSTTGTLGVSECMDEYSNCVRQEDVCGENFEECTTNVLFHLQMPKCDSVLLSCNASGVSMLFGSGAQFNATSNNLSTVDSYVEGSGDKEVENYIYPKPDSKLGDWIQTAWKVNSLNAQQCSKKYTSCLNRDSVCGADFELCTSKKEFKKQAVFCTSTLARCSVDGKKALFGSTTGANTLVPDSDSAIDQLIIAGAGLAAGNAVNTCYKVADQCILKACGKNPARCTVDKSNAAAEMMDYIENNKSVPAGKVAEWANRITTRDKKTYIRNMCQETIGNNKYCYMTHIANVGDGGEFTTESGKAIKPEQFETLVGKLSEFERKELYDDVYDDIYDTRINGTVGQRIADLMAEYDAKTRDKCLDTIRSCVMQTCGGGVGSVCYHSVFGLNGSKHINSGSTYENINQGCRAFINADPNCQYSAVVSGEDGYWTLGDSGDAFDAVFPAYNGGSYTDLLGAVTALEGELATSYNAAAIDKMKKQCANTAISCVKSMCGKDYSNCFRNRTDITAGLYDTGSSSFDASMNKQMGILDYNIVTGLCVNTVKNAKVCEEHLKINSYNLAQKFSGTGPWGNSSDVRSGWLNSAENISVNDGSGASFNGIKLLGSDVVIGCRVDSGTASEDCKDNNLIMECDYVDEDGCMYTEQVTQSQGDYLYSNAANTLFQEVLMDLEKEAQAKYSAKLTKEQNICLGNNKGGIKGNSDNGSAFMWVKLKSGKVPGSYPQKGLKANQIIASNDIYGSFCRAKITVVSDDEAINEALGDKATAYFAVGDAFECGSWIDKATWNNIEKKVKDGAGMAGWKKDLAWAWGTVGGGLLGTGVGALVGNYLANGQIGSGGGLLNSDAKLEANEKTNAGSCVNNLEKCLDYNFNDVSSCRAGLRDARAAGINVSVSWNGTTTGTTVKCDTNNNRWCPRLNEGADRDAIKTFCQLHGWCCSGVTRADFRVQHSGVCVGTNGEEYREGQELYLNNATIQTANISDADKTQIERVLSECRNKVQNNKSSRNASLVGGTIGLLAGAGLGAGITGTVIKAKDNQAKDKAVAEWQETMGEHIRCYVGGEDVGGYGDYVSFNFEDMN